MEKLNRPTVRSLQFRDKYTKFCGWYEAHAIAYTMAGKPMACAPKVMRGFLDMQLSLLSQVFVVPDQTCCVINK